MAPTLHLPTGFYFLNLEHPGVELDDALRHESLNQVQRRGGQIRNVGDNHGRRPVPVEPVSESKALHIRVNHVSVEAIPCQHAV